MKSLRGVIAEPRGGATLESLIREANEGESTLFVFEVCDLYYKGEKQINKDVEKQIDPFKGKKNWIMATFYAPAWATQGNTTVVRLLNRYTSIANASNGKGTPTILNSIQHNNDGHVVTKDHLLELDGIHLIS